MTQRSHAHIWCGGQVSYVMGLRMGGIAPHLGLVLTEGSIVNYSIERDTAQSSNNRGLIILHPEPVILLPGAFYKIAWELFWHEGKDDFYLELQAIRASFTSMLTAMCSFLERGIGSKYRMHCPC